MKRIQKAYLLLLAISLSAGQALAQGHPEEEAVKAVISQLFDAMKQADSSRAVNCFAAGALMETVARTPQQTDTVRSNAVAQFGSRIRQQPAGTLDERISFSSVLIDGNLAHVWTPYRFYVNGQFSHCGVNSFEVVKLNGQWKIRYIIDTRRKEGCD